MNNLNAQALLATGCDPGLALRWHLRYAHADPIDPRWLQCCAWVIERAVAGESLDTWAPVPRGHPPLTAAMVVRLLRLDPWLPGDDDEPPGLKEAA
jgi:hypothetical protein